ncbi:MAG TPA: hypothetical protein VIA06_17340 [Candidatus Dormibacteraeota bacterium]|jgi:hypothetical protein|nr:hypothetical protein [Candidatus Dormibacteraeota bacterium]
MAALAPAAFAISWLGGAILLLSHARRGVVLGLVLLTAGLALGAHAAGRDQVALALVAGGAVTAALRMRDGLPGWGLLPAGSTPRLVMSLLVLILGLLMGATVKGTTLPVQEALVVVALGAGRLLSAGHRAVALAGAAAVALALASLGGEVTAIAGAAVAAVLGTLPTGGDVEAAA